MRLIAERLCGVWCVGVGRGRGRGEGRSEVNDVKTLCCVQSFRNIIELGDCKAEKAQH